MASGELPQSSAEKQKLLDDELGAESAATPDAPARLFLDPLALCTCALPLYTFVDGFIGAIDDVPMKVRVACQQHSHRAQFRPGFRRPHPAPASSRSLTLRRPTHSSSPRKALSL